MSKGVISRKLFYRRINIDNKINIIISKEFNGKVNYNNINLEFTMRDNGVDLIINRSNLLLSKKIDLSILFREN